MNQEKVNVPPIVFKIVWPILYSFLIICVILFSLFPTSNKNLQLWINIIFWFGILMNLCWPPVYFYYKNILFSKILLILLVVFGLISVILFSYSDSKYKWIIFSLYFIYFLWLCFALYLIL